MRLQNIHYFVIQIRSKGGKEKMEKFFDPEGFEFCHKRKKHHHRKLKCFTKTHVKTFVKKVTYVPKVKKFHKSFVHFEVHPCPKRRHHDHHRKCGW